MQESPLLGERPRRGGGWDPLDICKKWQLVLRPGGAWHLCLVLASGPFSLRFAGFIFSFSFPFFVLLFLFLFFCFSLFLGRFPILFLLFLLFLLHLFCLHEWKRQECSALSLKRSQRGLAGGSAVSKDPTRTKEQYYSHTHTHEDIGIYTHIFVCKPRHIRIGITCSSHSFSFSLSRSLGLALSLSLSLSHMYSNVLSPWQYPFAAPSASAPSAQVLSRRNETPQSVLLDMWLRTTFIRISYRATHTHTHMASSSSRVDL